MQKKLTKLQAYNAMSKLFKIYYQQTKSDDLGSMLGSMSFLGDTKIVDDAMLEIWKESLDKILQHKNLRDYQSLTVLQAFIAMGQFLENYCGVTDLEIIIQFLQKNARLARQKQLVDPILWKNWLQCVDEVLAVKDSRYYLKLLPK